MSARRRAKQTRWSVKAADRIARVWISIGGIGTILAVSGVCVFLVAVVVPLFLPGSSRNVVETSLDGTSSEVIHLGVDEYRVIGWTFHRDGSLRVFRLDSGEPLSERQVVAGDSLSAWSFPLSGDHAALGFVDGSVRFATIGFATDFLADDSVPENLQALAPGEPAALGDAILQKTPEGQWRRQRLKVNVAPPIQFGGEAAIVSLDHVWRDNGSAVLTLDAAGALCLNTVRQTENLLTGEIVSQVRRTELPSPEDFRTRPAKGEPWPSHINVTESGRTVTAIWADGTGLRYDLTQSDNPVVAEALQLAADDATVTSVRPMLGRGTILVGDSRGRVGAWFQYNSEDADTPDGAVFANARVFEGSAGVTSLAPSPRGRVVAVGYADGSIRVFQVTSAAKILDIDSGSRSAITKLAIAPKGDGIVALSHGRLWHWDIDIRHPEATLSALFTPVWYEGYPKAEHVWQSSGGTDDFEPKLGMWPLVFGTLKATFYSMLFGIPLALLAAIFSSEFLAPSLRTRVKTLIEFMASLPSVVLGFLAALVFAPFVQKIVPTTLVAFLTIPCTFLLGAYVWQILPHRIVLRMGSYRLLFLMALLPLGMLLAVWLGPVVERAFFVGDIRTWLDGNRGNGFGGWFLLLVPVSSFVVVVFMIRTVTPAFRRITAEWGHRGVALLDFARFAGALISIFALATMGAWLLQQVGLDPRGSGRFFDTYAQRNALVVGFIMGFAVIPIIYTIAEDALNAVPEHLRAASLGAGATQWQTAVRIVIPTAMSGLFSAIMIGLGRAVGETMIVLMAAGNTPVLEMNIFNGFRTLSANIAVELPEAVRDSTHYRTLFLAALILFAMTFVINTIAEAVRLRFRKRAHQL